VVIVSSTLHEKGVINFQDLNSISDIELAKQGKISSRHIPAYQNSKLMNIYFMKALADRLKDAGVDVSALCPGFCYTNLFRYLFDF
jgi:NAD(P)-dependent dehydrogenase (short-subunit alcohol dehydrogenase family)